MPLIITAGSGTVYTYAVAGQTFTIGYRPQFAGAGVNVGSVGGHVDRLRLWPAGTSHNLTPTVDVTGPVASADGFTWTFTVPPIAVAGSYDAQVDWTPNTGSPQVNDTMETLLVLPFSGSLGGARSLAQVSDVRSSTNDTTTSTFAYLFQAVPDAQLLTFLQRASRVVESKVGCRLIPFTTTADVRISYDRHNYQPYARWAYISDTPAMRSELWVGSVTSIQLLDPFLSPIGTRPITTVTDFDVNTGLIRFDAAQAQFSDIARITYTGGFSPVPEDLIEATIYFAADAFLVGVDSADGQMDAADLYSRAMSRIEPWMVGAADTFGIA